MGALLVGVCAIGAAGAPPSAIAEQSTPTPTPTPTLTPTATDVRLAFSSSGSFGAWLVAGPLERSRLPDEARVFPRLEAPIDETANAPRWHLASANDGPLDVAAAIDSRTRDRMAYAAGVLHLEEGGRHVLLIGADDGVTVFVDGQRAFSSDAARPERDDEDLIPLDLAPGNHTVALALHRHGVGAWKLRARLLDVQLEPPRGAWWALPGTGSDDVRALAARMSLLALDRGMSGNGYRPLLTVRFPEGAPRGAHLGVRAQLVRSSGGPPVFDVDAGEVPIGDRGVRDLTVTLPRVGANEVEDDDWTVHADVAGRPLDLPFHPRGAVREAVARAGRAVDSASGPTRAATESIEHLRDRLAAFVAKGDGDVDAQMDDAHELDELTASLEQGRDPYGSPAGATGATEPTSWRTGTMRRAYRSPVDGRLSEFAVYVPPDFDPNKRYPLVVALHGMNGRPLEMIMWLFGHDDPAHDGYWEDRHPLRDLPTLEAIVVAPDGHLNAMYRDLGEDDVMRVVDWARTTYPIDPTRVTITGPSMGGIGAAACALHHPDGFAAAEPLCGYHSYFVRGDIDPRAMRPWERFLAEQRSNVFWAENGQYLPMYIVHGTKDLPEENSGVLIDRYEELKYDVTHEHPDLGHNVWQSTYEELKGARWLLTHRRPAHPRALRFKTPRTRWADDAWMHVRELSSSGAWGEVSARIGRDNTVFVATHGVSAIAIDRDPVRIDDAAPVSVSVDGDKLTYQAGEPIELYRERQWKAGSARHEGPYKHGTVTGPIRDVFHEPLLFVWGASDPAQARANEEVARAWAKVHAGVRVDYPLMSDTDFYARGEPLANDHALFLVGNARSNRVVRELEPELPIRVDGSDIVLGSRRIGSRDGPPDRSQLGASFVRPNPRRIDRYLVVVEGIGPLGTWRSLSLPELLPDFVVFDEDVAPAHGLLVLGTATLRAGGFFGGDWSLPP
jgi:predicted esterase